MWTLEQDSSHVRSLNGQLWSLCRSSSQDKDAKAAQESYAGSRPFSHQASDTLIRLQNGDCPQLEAAEATSKLFALQRALRFYSTIQADDGHWPGDFGGPMFLLPGLVITLYVTGALNVVLSKEHQHQMQRYLFNHQNEDGGWGLHAEGQSTMLGTGLSYVMLRLLKLVPSDECLEKARCWILDHGGVTKTPSWGKFWLAVLGVYDWQGVNPLPPEMYLLPEAVPLYPGRMWCHCRMIYLPMSYVYGKRFSGKPGEATLALRQELYNVPYERVNWALARNACAKEDLYCPKPLVQHLLWSTLHNVVEPLLKAWPFDRIRQKALATVMEHIHYEDESSSYICLGAVSKAMNMLCCWIEDPDSKAFKLHLARVYDYLWVAEDGMKMQGTSGSQLWDTVLSVHALRATGMYEECGPTLKKAHSFIDKTQIQENYPGDFRYFHRHISKGSWPFSTRDSGWPVSDCTAEGLKAALDLSRLPSEMVGEPIPIERLEDAVNIILSYQNANGGVSSYELTRSPAWIELFNPSEMFADITIDYQYVECTSSCVQALCNFRECYPKHRTEEVDLFIHRACKFIEESQREDGSWYGSWGICFTYGTWFGVSALVAAGGTYANSLAIRKACDFLLSKQLPCGGWGESYLSSQRKEYTNLENERAHLVNTSWGMLALMEAGQEERDSVPLHKAATLLVKEQLPNGDFPQQEMIGVFNKTCAVNYAAYRCIFPIWALGQYCNKLSL